MSTFEEKRGVFADESLANGGKASSRAAAGVPYSRRITDCDDQRAER